MKRILMLFAVLAFAIVTRLDAREPQLAHMVFFTLAEDSKENRDTLIAACQKYLTGHEGTVYFSAGSLADDLDREVNDREFHVSLHLVFANKKAHDTYATHPRHRQFIDQQKQLWSKVRVFDSYLPPPAHDSIPTGAKNFAGMFRGRVVATQTGQIIVEVNEITSIWRHNKAQNPKALVGKNVFVKARSGEGQVAKFLNAVKAGESVKLDVAHRDGDTLTLLELTEDQRDRVRE